MDAGDPFHDRLLSIVLSLPEAYEDRPWGSVHCKVAGKIFVSWGRLPSGEVSVGFKTDKTLQSMLLASDPRFSMAAYVGKHGWVDMKIGKKPNWAEVEQFIKDSYRLIAPKKLVKHLDSADPGAAASKKTDPSPKRPAALGAKRPTSPRAERPAAARAKKPAQSARR